MIDTHVHLDLLEAQDDLTLRLNEALAVGVTDVITISVDPRQSPLPKGLVPAGLRVHQTVGIHPQSLTTEKDLETALAVLRTRLQHERPVAIGEMGLDRRANMPSPALQSQAFVAQLALAQETDLPVVLHGVRRDGDMIAHLDEALLRRPLRGVWHGYSGARDTLKQVVTRGLLVSIGFMICDPRARRVREAVGALPLSHLLIETDAPPFAPRRLAEVASAVAEIMGRPVEEIVDATTANARRLFGLVA